MDEQRQCPSCGMKVNGDDAFCPICGASVPRAGQPQPGAPMNTAPPPPQSPQGGYNMPPPGQPAPQNTPQQAPQAPPPQAPQQGGWGSAPAPQTPQPGMPPQQPMPPQQAAPPPQAPPTGYGGQVPPPPPPQNGGWQGAQQPQGGGYPPARPPVVAMEPPKKKAPAALIVMICIVVVAAAAIGAYFLFFRDADGSRAAAAEYQVLLSNIAKAKSPEEVARYKGDLDTLLLNHPDVVDSDLSTLMDLCVDYENARENENKYEYMLEDLQDLAARTGLDEIAGVIDTLTDTVEDDYAAFVQNQPPPEPDPPAPDSSSASSSSGNTPPVNPGNFSPTPEIPAQWQAPIEVLEVVLTDIDGEEAYVLAVQNNSGKTIVEFDVWLFCYDAYGNEIISRHGDNWEWGYSSLTIAPGEIVEPDWTFEGCFGTVIAVPYIAYIEYADGTTWGMTDDGVTDEMEARVAEVKPYMDEHAMMMAEAGYYS